MSHEKIELTSHLKNRLLNWKFSTAADLAKDELPEGDVRRILIEKLALRYANSGWFDGTEGEFIEAILSVLGVFDQIPLSQNYLGPVSEA